MADSLRQAVSDAIFAMVKAGRLSFVDAGGTDTATAVVDKRLAALEKARAAKAAKAAAKAEKPAEKPAAESKSVKAKPAATAKRKAAAAKPAATVTKRAKVECVYETHVSQKGLPSVLVGKSTSKYQRLPFHSVADFREWLADIVDSSDEIEAEIAAHCD